MMALIDAMLNAKCKRSVTLGERRPSEVISLQATPVGVMLKFKRAGDASPVPPPLKAEPMITDFLPGSVTRIRTTFAWYLCGRTWTALSGKMSTVERNNISYRLIHVG